MRPTIASFDAPTWLRRRWRGHDTPFEIIALFNEYASRAMRGELIWR